jgi:hypothetical protein
VKITVQGMNIEVTNDFIEYLLKTMISGMGIPPEYLSYAEQTEFARSLGMMNGKFVRTIIVYQKVFGEQFTKLFRILYKNEFLDDYTLKQKKQTLKKKKIKNKGEIGTVDTKEEKEAVDKETKIANNEQFNLNNLEVRFPSPQSLNMTALNEQISNSQQVIEFLVASLVDPNNQELTESVKREITKEVLSSFDWSKYEDIVDQAKIKLTEDKIKQASVQTGEGEDMSGGMGGGMGY